MFKYVISVILLFVPMITLGAEFVEGKDYEVINSGNTMVSHGSPVSVSEFFSFGCPWCYRLDSAIYQWTLKQGKSIHFSKVPVVFNSNWDNYARAYYIMDSLSLGKKVHDALFKTIIVDKQPLNTHQDMVDFFTKNGVDARIAESAFSHSPSIELRLKTDAAMMAKYHINAVPTLVVNHQYKTNLQMAKTEERLFEIMDYLLKKSRIDKRKMSLLR